MWQSDDPAWEDVVFVPREWGGGKTPFNKNKPSSKSENKMGSVPSIFFVGAFCFLKGPTHQVTDRGSRIAKMHSCERFDHAVKPSR